MGVYLAGVESRVTISIRSSVIFAFSARVSKSYLRIVHTYLQSTYSTKAYVHVRCLGPKTTNQ